MNESRPIRILHVVDSMGMGGVETWLVQVLRRIDRSRFRIDIMTNTQEPQVYDEEVRALGSEIHPCLKPTQPWRYARNFRRILDRYGPYDIVHCHLHLWCGFVLRLAHRSGVPIRIAHSRVGGMMPLTTRQILRILYAKLMKRWIRKYANVGLAVSRVAADSLLGPNWEQDEGRRLLFSAIDLSVFRTKVDKASVRAELGIPSDAVVLGHAGRFHEQKNHCFLLRIFKKALESEPRFFLLLLGKGHLKTKVERLAKDAGLFDRIFFAGVRQDITRLMLGAMDLFLMPSLYEGLPRVGLEAQAAGLPLLVSDTITEELTRVPELVHRMSLSQSPEIWAERILEILQSPKPISQSEALAQMEDSPMNIDVNVRELEQIYLDCMKNDEGVSSVRLGLVEPF